MTKSFDKPKKRQTKIDEDKIRDFIEGGGDPPKQKNKPQKKKKVQTKKTENMKEIRLRVDGGLIEGLDKMLNQNIAKISRNTWIVQAIAEKLERDK